MVCGCLEAILGRLEMSVQSRRMMGFHEVGKSLRIEDTQARAIVTPVRFLAACPVPSGQAAGIHLGGQTLNHL